MSTDCERCRELILDHEWLDVDVKRRLMDHLDECPACRQQFDAVNGIGEMILAEAAELMPADLTDRIMAGVQADTAAAEASGPLTPQLAVLILLQCALLVLLHNPLVRAAGWARALWHGTRPFQVSILDSVGPGLAALASALDADWAGLTRPFWLPALVGVFILCLFSGGVLYAEEKHHA